MQSDNGSEFGGMQRILDEWPGSCSIIHGRPRHPQSQGLIERGNRSVQEKLTAYEAGYRGDSPTPWHTWLPLIQCKFACAVHNDLRSTLLLLSIHPAFKKSQNFH